MCKCADLIRLIHNLRIVIRIVSPMHFTITSTQNPKVKNLLALEKPRERKKQCLFVIEGKKEIGLALEAGYKIGNLFFCDEMITPNELKSLGGDEKLLI